MPTLTLVDILGIQRFVFASNRLQDVVGGSELISECSGKRGWLKPYDDEDKVLFAAGGNAMLKFESLSEAREFGAWFSRRLLGEVPGLEAVMAHHEYPQGGLIEAMQEVQRQVAIAKTRRRPSVPLLGLGVTARCNETGAVATRIARGRGSAVAISAGLDARRCTLPRCRERDREKLKDFEIPGLEKAGLKLAFPYDNDDLGRTEGDTSWIGVVHVDGNSIGRKILEWLRVCASEGYDDDRVIAEYRGFSQGLNTLAENAFDAVCRRVVATIEKNERGRYALFSKSTGRSLELKSQHGDLFLPVRPILIGGDDLTFLCDGRLALDLAETALAVYEASAIDTLGPIRACAGVALVKSHAPFSRAYTLAEKLCSSAKGWLREKELEAECAVDWHVGMVDPHESLEELRAKGYRSEGHGDPHEPLKEVQENGSRLEEWQLTCRPYRLGSRQNPKPASWRWLAAGLLGDPSTEQGLRGRRWKAHRSKVRQLAVLVRKGPQGVADELDAWQTLQPELQLPSGLANGFIDCHRTPLLDAVELLDLHWPLEARNDVAERSAEK